MDEQIEMALRKASDQLASGGTLKGSGFWRAVARVKSSPELAKDYADRIARLDTQAFTANVKLRVPAAAGILAMLVATGAGSIALLVIPSVQPGLRPWLFLAAFGILDVSTHTLAHVIVGLLAGIRFTHFFIGGPPPPRPGAKTDYSTYLRASPRQRAVMHASGAVVTKLIPFVLIPVANAYELDPWVTWLLVVVGLLQIATDIAFSTKTSDWKKFLREWRAGS